MFENRTIFLKKHFLILFLLILGVDGLFGQTAMKPDFTWNNASYFNVNKGESVFYENTEIRLLSVSNQFNTIKVGVDTVQCRVSRRTPAITTGGLRIFVADNFRIKAISGSAGAHSLLQKDALICVSSAETPMLNTLDFVFPVSFNDGFVWSCDEDSYLYSFKRQLQSQQCVAEGIDFDLHDARGIEKHRIVAVENSTVVWIFEDGKSKNEVSVLLQSNSQPEIFYLYSHLFSKKIEVRKGQTLEKGEILGTIWGDNQWGHLTFSVINSAAIPEPGNCADGIINGFPNLFELYHQTTAGYNKTYRKGRIFFGKPAFYNGNQKNASDFEDYSGKGWITANWNIAEKTETAAKGSEGNVRLGKVLFKGTRAEVKNPVGWYDYEIRVPNNAYRIRVRLGDVEQATWQRVAFENIDAGTFILEKGQMGWTSERVVKVNDERLTIRIYIDESGEKPAGISEIVFQQAL